MAIAYLRLSPRDPDDERLGLEVQRGLIRRWAEGQGVVVVVWFEDIDVSGDTKAIARKGLQGAIAALREHKARVLIVAKRDRLARDVMEAGIITRAVEKHGAVVRSADGIGGETPAERMVTTVVDAAAQYELELLKERTRAALAAKAARGEMVGKPPYGYRAVPDATRLTKGGKPIMLLEADPDEQAVVAAALNMEKLGLSTRVIARELSTLGMRSRAGTPFSHVQVSRMLRRAAGGSDAS